MKDLYFGECENEVVVAGRVMCVQRATGWFGFSPAIVCIDFGSDSVLF